MASGVSALATADSASTKEATKRGGFLLSVNVDDAQADKVHQFLDGTDPVDLDERERQLKATGFAAPARRSAKR